MPSWTNTSVTYSIDSKYKKKELKKSRNPNYSCQGLSRSSRAVSKDSSTSFQNSPPISPKDFNRKAAFFNCCRRKESIRAKYFRTSQLILHFLMGLSWSGRLRVRAEGRSFDWSSKKSSKTISLCDRWKLEWKYECENIGKSSVTENRTVITGQKM